MPPFATLFCPLGTPLALSFSGYFDTMWTTSDSLKDRETTILRRGSDVRPSACLVRHQCRTFSPSSALCHRLHQVQSST